jgi:hypothetical protein
LFLVTLLRPTKSQDIFRLSSLCHISNKVVIQTPERPLFSATTARSLATSGLLANNLTACGVAVATCTKTARKRGTQLQCQHAATASWLKERHHIPLQACQGKNPREHPKTQGKGVLINISKNKLVLCNSVLRPNGSKDKPGGSHKFKGSRLFKTHTTGTRSVSSSSNCKQ